MAGKNKLKILKDTAREYGTPVFIIDHKTIRKQYEALRKHLPRVGLYYAIKANPNPEIIKTLADDIGEVAQLEFAKVLGEVTSKRF